MCVYAPRLYNYSHERKLENLLSKLYYICTYDFHVQHLPLILLTYVRGCSINAHLEFLLKKACSIKMLSHVS